jgi:hypothetical protein
VFALCLVGDAVGQTSTGSITGVVVDSTGGVIPGADIELTNTATNATARTVSLDGGIFRFPAVPVGDYRISAELTGFERTVLDRVVVSVGQTVRVELRLAVGGVQEAVVVRSGAVAIVQTESAAIQTVVPAVEIESLPLNQRNFIQLVALQPNAVPAPRTSITQNRGGYNAIAGMPIEATSITIDGISIKETADPRTTILLNPDVIEEFQSASSNYSAAQGQAGGAQVNLVTRSGSNIFRGSAYEFFRHDKLDAKNYFEAEKPPYRHNQYGVTLGGPLLRDKLFFYAGFEGMKIRLSRTQLFTVPTIAQRSGDFRGGPQIFDPLSYDPACNCRTPFPNNTIPAGRLSPEALRALDLLFPVPNRDGNVNNLVGAKPDDQDTDQFSIRTDYKPSLADTLFVRYIYYNPRKVHGGFAALPNFADQQDSPVHNAVGSYTRTLTPRFLLQTRVGFSRFDQILQDVDINEPINDQIGITGTSTQYLGNPSISISGLQRTGAVGNAPNNRTDYSYFFTEDFMFSTARHGLSFGFNFTHDQVNGGFNTNARGSFTFTNQYTRQIGQPATGSAVADFMLGYPFSSARGLGDGFRRLRQNKFGLYIADDWKALPNVTMNVGLRWEYFEPAYEADNNLAGFDERTGTIVLAGADGVPRGFREPYYKGFQPRLGLAYRPGNSNRTVIRGAYGINFMPLGTHPVPFSMVTNPPLFISESFVGNATIPDLTLRNAFPGGRGVASTSLTTIDRDAKDPYIQQWNVAAERELGHGVTVELAYVGNKGSRLRQALEINTPEPAPGNVGPRRPFPNFATITSYENVSRSLYNSFVVKGQKRFSGNLAFLSSYTWSKLLSTGGIQHPGDLGNAPVRDFRDIDAEWGRDYFDVRHRSVSSIVWMVPVGKGQRVGENWPAALQHLLGNWQVNAIITLQSGFPLTPTLGYDNTNDGLTQDRPDVIGDPNSGPQTVEQWFNTGAFVAPPTFSYGNAGKNIIEGPGTKTLDLSFFKHIPMNRGSLQFRIETFNVTNTPQFNQPGATFGTSSFGVISSAGPPRQVQLGLRYSF